MKLKTINTNFLYKTAFVLTLLLYTVFSKLPGQIDRGVKFNAGISIIEDDPVAGNDRYTEKVAPSLNAGYYLKYVLSKKFIFRTSADINLIQSRETYFPEHKVNRFIAYLSMPLIIETNGRKFNMGLGIRNSIRLFGGGKDQWTASIDGMESAAMIKYKSSEYAFTDFGAMVNLSYAIFNGMRIEWTYYHGFGNIHSEEAIRTSVNAWKARQMTLGLIISTERTKNIKRKR